MRVRDLSVCVLLTCTSVAYAQEGKITKRAETPVGQQKLLKTEMFFTIDEVDIAISRVLKLPSPKTQRPKTSTTELAKRDSIIQELNRIFERTKSNFKVTPHPIPFDTKAISLPKESTQRANLEKLIRWGFIHRVSPIATSENDSLTLSEFGNLMGQFVARLAELTHKPSPKWSPFIMDPNG
jgi:hypothetical protein